MGAFLVQDAQGGMAIGFGPSYPGVEIALRPTLAKQHGDTLVLSAALATDKEIDEAIDVLKDNLEALRSEAKKALRSYREKAQSPKS